MLWGLNPEPLKYAHAPTVRIKDPVLMSDMPFKIEILEYLTNSAIVMTLVNCLHQDIS